jgi:phosphoribosylglycinamide formyltransferase 1
MSPLRIAVLVSGSGSNLQALIDARQAGELPIEIALVVSDRPDAYGLQRALAHKIPALYLPLTRPRNADIRAAWELQLADLINCFSPDLVIFSGFMRVLSAAFLARCVAPAINQHPALLPDGGGDTVTTTSGAAIPALRGAHVVAEALELGLPATGCSIHRATPTVDDGPVLARAEVAILPGDDQDSLHERIKAEERRLLVAVVRQLAAQHETSSPAQPGL